MIYHFILNPKSGKHRKQIKMEEHIKSACAKRQLDYHIYYTTCVKDATEYVRQMIAISAERQRFICVGGDGTINEIVNSAPCNPNIEFGVIPGGSGNDFARNFTNHRLFEDIDAQVDGISKSLDLIRCNDRYCVNVLNVGFDCGVANKANELKSKFKFPSPSIAYIFGIIIMFFKKFGTHMQIILENGEVLDQEFTLAAIGNGKFYGGGFMALPLSKLDDGLIDICAINKIGRLTFLSLVSKYKNGTFIKDKKIMSILRYEKLSHLKLIFDSSIPVCMDGEIIYEKELDIELVPHAFNFVIPNGCDFKYEKP